MGRTSSKAGGGRSPAAPYGTEFKTLHKVGNIKFIQYNGDNPTVPQYTATRGRVYVLVGNNGKLKSIVYFDNKLDHSKQIDLDHFHDKEKPHTHHGYFHSENDSAKGYAKPTPKEKQMVDRVEAEWYRFNNR